MIGYPCQYENVDLLYFTEVIRLALMMYSRVPLTSRNVEDLLQERGIDICHEMVCYWWNRFGPMFAGEIKKKRVAQMRGFRQFQWHLDEAPAIAFSAGN